MCLAYSPDFSLSPRGTSGGRVGEGGVRGSLGDAPPLPDPLLPRGRRGARDNGETLNTYAAGRLRHTLSIALPEKQGRFKKERGIHSARKFSRLGERNQFRAPDAANLAFLNRPCLKKEVGQFPAPFPGLSFSALKWTIVAPQPPNRPPANEKDTTSGCSERIA